MSPAQPHPHVSEQYCQQYCVQQDWGRAIITAHCPLYLGRARLTILFSMHVNTADSRLPKCTYKILGRWDAPLKSLPEMARFSLYKLQTLAGYSFLRGE